MITLYRTDDAQNMYRFYHLRIEQTLFGEWALIREWGRIGSRRGQKLEAAKRRKGYSSAGNFSSRSATISAGR